MATTFFVLPLALLGQRTYAAVDMLETTAPYRDALGRPPRVVSPVQTDQVEGFPGPVSFFRDLRRGVFQLWSPEVAGGAPTGTLPFNGLLSPFSAGYLVLPAWYAIGLKAALALLFCQAFTYLLMRRLGAAVGPSTLTAVAYALAGTNLVLIHRVGAVLVLPALLWATHRLVDRPTWGRTAALAVLVGWTWFEGFPAGFVYCVYATAAWAAWLAFYRRPEHGPSPVRRLAAVAGGLAWGVAISCVTLVPFVSEIISRGTLSTRSFDRHLPGIQAFGLLDLSVTRPLFTGGPAWSGPNAVESVSHIGWIVAVAAGAGLVGAALGRLRVSREGAVAWPFFAGMVGVGLVLTYLGGPLLAVAYRLPGIADNPIARSRFLLNLAAAVLAGLTLDAWWRRRAAADGRTFAPQGVSMTLVAVMAATFGLLGPDLWRAARDASQAGEVALSMAFGIGLAGMAVALAVAGCRRPRAGTIVVVGLAALLFVQLALPLRHFTPEAPVSDFYTEQAGHRVVRDLVGDRYRFMATGFNFYPNSGQVHGIPDLRGITLQSRPFTDLVSVVNPVAFERDPLKLILTKEEIDLASPVLDDLAVRYVALGTNEPPYGQVVGPDGAWETWAPLSGVPAPAFEGTAPGPIGGVAVPLRVSGTCAAAAIQVTLTDGATALGRSARPAFDVNGGGWTTFALTGQALAAGAHYRLEVSSTAAGCQVDVGMIGARVARQMIVLDPDAPVRLVATEGAWIYERPSASELVSAHTRWRSFPSRSDLLAWLSSRSPAEADVAAFVGPGPPAPSTDVAATAKVLSYRIDGGTVRAETSSDAPSLVVVSMNRSSGWSATIDGHHAGLVPVDGALMGVFVPPGDHVVRLHYLPRSFVAGASVTGIALAAAAVALVLPAWRRRRRQEHEPPTSTQHP